MVSIGILTLPGEHPEGHIPEKYTSFVKSAGATYEPLLYNDFLEELEKKLNSVSGVLLTGGNFTVGAPFSRYLETARIIVEIVIERKIPCFAICLGFEILCTIVGNCKCEVNHILEDYDAQRQASTLQFVSNDDKRKSVFESFPLELIDELETKQIVAQNHKFGVSSKKFEENEHLKHFFHVLTTCTDRKRRVYVSICAEEYPIIAFQWHPEKMAPQVSKLVADFFIRLCSEARRSLTV